LVNLKQGSADNREIMIRQWLENDLGYKEYSLKPASADASFRRYFRVYDTVNDCTKIIMDAPPNKEDSRPFIRLAQSFSHLGLNVPQVFAQNFEYGFFLLSDLGCKDYLSSLDSTNANALYYDAIQALVSLQFSCNIDLPSYDSALLHQEMNLFIDWYLAKHCQRILTDSEQQLLERVFNRLVDSALAQPQVCVHRDYHSRNLMLCNDVNPGILDFQDAVHGPITYDLVSLLRDCYIAWPDVEVDRWREYYLQMAVDKGLLKSISSAQFEQWFDLMGMQRHLKAIGIFARLNYRDGKSGYLKDIPRTMQYVLSVSQKYAEFNEFNQFINELIQ